MPTCRRSYSALRRGARVRGRGRVEVASDARWVNGQNNQQAIQRINPIYCLVSLTPSHAVRKKKVVRTERVLKAALRCRRSSQPWRRLSVDAL